MGETREIVVRAAPDTSSVDPGNALPGDGPVDSSAVRLCSQVRADLDGADFDVERTGEPTGRRGVGSEGAVEWSWAVTPLRAGEDLQLVLTLYVSEPDVAPIELESFRKTIVVEANREEDTKGFVRDWLIPAGITAPVVVAALGWLVVRWRTRRAARSAVVVDVRDAADDDARRPTGYL
ncbi:hypothetical protein [Kineococcus xinjiangensis]|uniref:hypothetical protein n=1 Tax=Kineococcus xinjiangensis TaxID=512762 RepID=UPI001304F67D|nr:hypothetical protein [Kineococcus xinjiangensis]